MKSLRWKGALALLRAQRSLQTYYHVASITLLLRSLWHTSKPAASNTTIQYNTEVVTSCVLANSGIIITSQEEVSACMRSVSYTADKCLLRPPPKVVSCSPRVWHTNTSICSWAPYSRSYLLLPKQCCRKCILRKHKGPLIVTPRLL